jgi:hypothetical protein
VDRDKAVHDLLKKLCQVYSFITQDEMLDQISSMRIILQQISQQALECAQFIENYSETKKFCESQQAAALCTVSSFYLCHREETRKERGLGNE